MNVRKHADTDRAEVEIQRTPLELQIRVSDAGKGFDLATTSGDGFGLDGVAERVRLAGGSFFLDAKPGAGSCVRARLPIATDDTSDVAELPTAPAIA